MNKVILSAENIVKKFYVGDSVLDVLKGVDLELLEGQIIAIMGESGAGKSTLLHLLETIDRPTSGQLKFNGENLGEKSESDLAHFRNNQIGFIFQFHHLLPEFNAFENVLMPALIAGKNSDSTARRVEYLLDRVGLSNRANHRPGELSGGELQRVAVARALINEPSIVLADEPSGNLDHRNSEMLHNLIWGLARENGYSFVIVTHDLALAKKADRLMLLSEGVTKEVDCKNIDNQLLT